MVDVAEGLKEVAFLVRDDGFPVAFVDGWRTRGRGRLTPKGAVNHWTAGPRTGDHPSLDIVTHGRAGLRNALCNTYSSREPRLYIVAARTAWHAGQGSWRGLEGNSVVLGHEAENSGHGEWTDEHLALIASLDRAQCEVFGYSVDMVCDHFEWTPRKVDRMDVGGEPWRERIRAESATPSVHPPEEDEMLVKFEDGDSIKVLYTGSGRVVHLSPSAYKAVNKLAQELPDQVASVGKIDGLTQAGAD